MKQAQCSERKGGQPECVSRPSRRELLPSTTFLIIVKRTHVIVLLTAADAVIARSCECAAPMPACAYVAADAIFVGRVSYTNDDRSGTFVQATLVRFDVEEIFKGISAGTKHIWVDPGSFTSCYQEYRLGERYLIVAQRRGHMASDSAAMTLAPRKANNKPLPPSIDPARPPIIYWAPECSGSRSADHFPHIDMDYAMLRAYRAGQPLPRAFGRVYLEPFRGWPELNGPPLPGARVTLTGNGKAIRTATRADGTFAVRDAPAGVYSIGAELPPFVSAQPRAILTIPEIGCGSGDFAMRTTTELRGVVLDHRGRAAARIPVEVEVLSTAREKYPTGLSSDTDAEGRFAVVGIPDVEVRLSCGSSHPSTTGVPFPLVYYPDSPLPSGAHTLRLHDGERRAGMVLRLPEAPEIVRVAVKVSRADGSAVNGAFVGALLDGDYTEVARTGAEGIAELPCLQGLRYQLDAQSPAGRPPWSGIVRSRPVPFRCGKNSGPLALTLDR